MPFVEFEELDIILKDSTHTSHICDLFSKLFPTPSGGANLTSCSGKAASILNPDEHKRRDGVSYKILHKVDDVTERRRGSSVKKMPSMSVELDAFAKDLYDDCRQILNKAIMDEYDGIVFQTASEKVQGTIGEGEDQIPKIDSRCALTRTLLLRLVATVLSSSLTNDNKEVMRNTGIFIQQLIANGYLNSHTEFKEGIKAWDKMVKVKLEKTLEMVQIIHKNRISVGKALKILETGKKYTQALLLIMLSKGKFKEDDLAPGMVDTYLIKNAYQLLGKKIEDYLVPNELEKTEIEDVINSCKEKERDTIRRLFYYLNKTDNLLKIFSKIESLMTLTGWQCILSGMIDFKKLQMILRTYKEDNEQTVEDCKSFIEKEYSTSKIGIDKHHSGFYMSYSNEINLVIAELEEVASDEAINYIVKYYEGIVKDLLELQESLPEDQKFVIKSVSDGVQNYHAQKLGGTQNSGDAQSSGGAQNSGDAQSSGGAQNSGDVQNSGGVQNSGDAQSSGGVQNSGDAQSSSGVQNSGDAQSSGGAQNSGDIPKAVSAPVLQQAMNDLLQNGEVIMKTPVIGHMFRGFGWFLMQMQKVEDKLDESIGGGQIVRRDRLFTFHAPPSNQEERGSTEIPATQPSPKKG